MDIEMLIKRIKCPQIHSCPMDGEYPSCAACQKNIKQEAATALSTFQAENEKLRAEVEQVKAERNGAIKDLNDFLSLDELCPIQCKWCKWEGTNCDGKTPEWRGQKEG